MKIWHYPYEFETGRYDDGKNNHEPFFISFTYPELILYDKSVKPEDSVYLEAFLQDDSKNPIGDKNLNFFIDGKFVGSGMTDNKGYAYCIYRDTDGLGEHLIQVVFKGQNEGDSDYSWCDQSATLTISEDAPNQDGPSFKDSDGTPGFELVLVVCALALVLLWKRKRD